MNLRSRRTQMHQASSNLRRMLRRLHCPYRGRTPLSPRGGPWSRRPAPRSVHAGGLTVASVTTVTAPSPATVPSTVPATMPPGHRTPGVAGSSRTRDFTADTLNPGGAAITCTAVGATVALSRHGDRPLLEEGGGLVRSTTTYAPRWSPTRSRWPWPTAAAGFAASVSTPTGAPDAARMLSPRRAADTTRHPAHMGRVGSSDDSALAEWFCKGPKRELVPREGWTSKAQTRLEFFRRLSYYNRRRGHSALGHLTPAEFLEQQLITPRTLSPVACNSVSAPGGQPHGRRYTTPADGDRVTGSTVRNVHLAAAAESQITASPGVKRAFCRGPPY